MTPDTEPAFTALIDLAAERIGGRVLYATDDFFAEKENLLKPGRGVFIADKFTENGKWMDGWESRRKREPGYDWAWIKLGAKGVVAGVDIDTHHFTGNFPEHASVDGLVAEGDPSPEELAARTDWVNLVPISRLQGSTRNLFAVANATAFTHLRLNIFPDGGVARFRVHGTVVPNWQQARQENGLVDLVAAENGGRAILANDMHFAHPNNLIMPGRSVNMGDGWETKRRRGPGHDWCILQLGAPGRIARIEVDTNHFKGNFPESCSIEGCVVEGEVPADFMSNRNLDWKTILPRTPLTAHNRHFFEAEALEAGGPYTHVRLSMYPDGGISRLRLWGRPAEV